VNIFYTDAASTDGFPNRCFLYNVDNGRWTERVFSQNIAGYGETIDTTVSFAIEDLIGTIEDQTWKLSGINATTVRPVLLLCATADNQTLEYSSHAADDDGIPIDVVIETKDFSTPHMKNLLDNLIVLGAGTGVTVLYSKDKGASWVSLGSKDFGVTVTDKKFWRQITFRTIRFRISASGYMRLAGLAFQTKLVSNF